MLLSMTGFGDARCQEGSLAVAVEVRTVNNRYLKLSIKSSDAYAPFEGDVERIVRETINRGTVNVTIRVDRVRSGSDFRLNTIAIQSYWKQLADLSPTLQGNPAADLGQLLVLPGVVDETFQRSFDVNADWEVIQRVLKTALTKLQEFRLEEGGAMSRDLRSNSGVIKKQLETISATAPLVAGEHRQKLLDRVRQALKDSSVQVAENDLIREVAVFADRADINEEITRLRCHLEQFEAFVDEPQSAGRKLDFLTQEIFREVNTIGSKANNVTIAHSVVEMKSAVDRIREVLQNVE